jgi:hypothetical protein
MAADPPVLKRGTAPWKRTVGGTEAQIRSRYKPGKLNVETSLQENCKRELWDKREERKTDPPGVLQQDFLFIYYLHPKSYETSKFIAPRRIRKFQSVQKSDPQRIFELDTLEFTKVSMGYFR